MADKKINIQLGFNADTSQAQQAIAKLQKTLQSIGTGSGLNINDSGIKKAAQAAKDLQIHLNNAYNATTGNFDLSKLNRGLSVSKQNIASLSSELLGAGAKGQQAFVQLAQSISLADRPMIGINQKLKQFGTTLANTARWQLSASLLQGFTGAISTAYNYAKDLNESLNNIRIVTGYSVEEISEFAVEANKAAKALSTTTTAYTDAALIFYQQGLSGKEVTERADAVIKMANVTGQAAQEVSDQMTAIWNNFDNGSKSLEYYADVITALGAATASSTEEISTGLEKFAAIAETVGLSYEYATAALATVTSTTRQSAEVVGTAFKTLFARIQDLELGKTLDDGTTLGQYSEALMKVGINIKDTNGEMKEMDQILDEMATKWDTLGKAEQTALAQNVAGVRQYTQLIALMENWDFMKQNLQTANSSSGALQEQADIYAESWEAANERVKASAETIYQAILDDQFFIQLTDGFASLLDSVNAFLDGVGGVKPLLIGIGSIFLQTISSKIQPALENLRHAFSVVFQGAQKQAINLSNQMNKEINKSLSNNNYNQGDQQTLQNARDLNILKSRLMMAKNLTDIERQRYEMEVSLIQQQQQEAENLAKNIDKRKEEISLMEKSGFDVDEALSTTGKQVDNKEQELMKNVDNTKAAVLQSETKTNRGNYEQAKTELAQYRAEIENAKIAQEEYFNTLVKTYNQEMQNTNGRIENSQATIQASDILQDYITQFETLSTKSGLKEPKAELAQLDQMLDMIAGNSLPEVKAAIEKALGAKSPKEFKGSMGDVISALKNAKIPAKDLEKILGAMGQKGNIKKIKEEYERLCREEEKLIKIQNELNQKIDKFTPVHMVTGIERLTSLAAGLGSLAMSVQSVRSVFDAWNNDDLTIGEKLTTTFMSFSMIVPSVMSMLKSFNTVLGISSLTAAKNNAQLLISNTLSKEQLSILTAGQLAQKMGIGIDQAELILEQQKIVAKLENFNLEKFSTNERIKGIAAKKLGITTDQLEIAISKVKAGATWKEALAEMGLLKGTIANTLVTKTGILGKAAMAISTKLLTAATNAETGSVWANTLAWMSNPIGWIVAIIMAAVAAIALLVVGIKALTDAYNADAIAAENAENAAKNLAEAYNECKQEYEDMISAMDSYKSAREALDSLTEGTKEYKQALKEANYEALKLLQNYGSDLNEGTDYYWEDGALIIKETSLEQIQQNKEQEVDQTYAAAEMANVEAKRMRTVSDITDLQRRIRDDNGVGDWDWIWKGVLDFAAMGAGSAATTVSRFNKAEDYEEAIDEAIRLGQEDSSIFTNQDALAKALGLDKNSEIVQALWANKEALREETKALEQSTNQEKLAAKQIAQNVLLNNENVQNNQYSEQLMELGGNIYQDTYKKLQKKYMSEDYQANALWFDTGTQEQKDLFDKYAELKGLKDLKDFDIDDYDEDGSVWYTYTDEDGEEREIQATQAEIAAVVAAAEAQEKLGGKVESLIKIFEKLAKEGGKAAEALKNFALYGDFGQTTVEDFDNYLKELSNVKIDDNIFETHIGLDGKQYKSLKEYYRGDDRKANEFFEEKIAESGDISGEVTDDMILEYQIRKKMSEEYDMDFLSSEIFQDIEAKNLAISLGFKNVDEMIQNMVQSTVGFKKETLGAKEIWQSVGLDYEQFAGLTNEALINLAEQIENMNYGPIGKRAGENYVAGLNSILNEADLSDEEISEALNQIAQIDWSDWDAFDQLQNIMKGFNYTIDLSNDKWSEFIQQMRKANNSLPDFSKIKSDLQQVSSIIQDLNFGETISDTDYEQLIKLGKGWEDFFILQADGSRKFIGNSQDIVRAQQDITENAIQNATMQKQVKEDLSEEQKKKYGNFKLVIDEAAGGDGKDGKLSQTTIDNFNKDKKLNFTEEQVMAYFGAQQLDQDKELQEVIKTAFGYDDARIKELVEEGMRGEGEGLNILFEALSKLIEVDQNEVISDLYEMNSSTAKNVSELDQLLQDKKISPEAYEHRLKEFNSTSYKLGQLEVDEDEFDEYVKDLMKIDDLTEEQAEEYALQLLRVEKGIESLQGTWDEYGEVVSNSANKGLPEYSAGIEALKEDFSKLTGIDVGFITDEMIEGAIASGDLQAALGGSYTALENLQSIALNPIDIMFTLGIDKEDPAYAEVMNFLNNTEFGIEFRVNGKLSVEGAKALAALLIAQGKEFEQVIGILESLGISGIRIDRFDRNGDYFDFSKASLEKADIDEADEPDWLKKAKQEAQDRATQQEQKRQNNFKDSIKDDKDAYEDLNKTIAKTREALNELQEAEDNLYGQEKLDNLDAQIEKTKELLGLTEDELAIDDAEINNAKTNLAKELKKAGVNNAATLYNKDGTINKNKVIEAAEKYVSNQGYSEESEEVYNNIKTAVEDLVSVEEKRVETLEEQVDYVKNIRELELSRLEAEREEEENKKEQIKTIKEYSDKLQKIKKIEQDLNKLERDKEGSYGKKRIGFIQAEIEANEELLDVYKSQTKGLEKDVTNIEKQLNIKYGTTNEKEILQKGRDEQSYYQKLANQQLALSQDENKTPEERAAAAELAASYINIANTAWEDAQTAVEEYGEAQDIVNENAENISDTINKIAEQHLEKINLEAELKLTITEVSRKEIDYYLGKIEDDFFSMAEGVALISSKAHLDLQDLSTYETKMNQILSDTALTAEQRAQALKELQDNFISSLQAVQEIDKQMLAYYGEALVASKEEFDSYASQLDNASSKLEHFSSLAGLIGKSYDRKYMGEILNAQYDVAKKNAEASKGYVDLLKQQKADIEEDLKTATGGQKELLEEELKAITQSLNEAEDEWLSDLEAMGEAAQAILENTLGKAREELEKSLYGSSIQDYIDSLDRLSAEQEGYLTETNKLYETNKLIRQAQMDMDKTSNIRAKQQYAEYIKQIEQKQKSGELSEYELSIAQAEFEVLQARIALEEAQSAKDQVRLTRDAEGNYGYVYTANANKVADAEQKLADAQNNLYNIGLDGYKEFTSKQAQLQQEALDAINEILEDETLSREEKEKKIAEIQEHYHTLMKQNEEQYQLAIGVMKENSYNNQIDYNTKSIVLADEFKTETNKYLGEVEDAYEDYDLKVDSITKTVGEDLGTLKTKTGEVKTETQNLKMAIDNLNENIADELQHVRDRTIEWGKFRDTLKEAVEYNEKLMEVNGDITRINSGDSTLIGKDISKQIMDYASGGGDNIEVLATYAASRSHKIARDKDLYKQLKAGEILSTEEILKKAGYDEKTIKAVLDRAKQSSLVASDSGMFFDTGGYTGSWGPEGRMAVLHEKEIVLNKQDTSNLLQAITMLREISNMIDRQAMYQSLSLLDSRIFDVFTERDNTLQQEVTIHAEFPNVNDHNEIEIALNDLITRASQYANRF